MAEPSLLIRDEITQRLWLEILLADRALQLLDFARYTDSSAPEAHTPAGMAHTIRIQLTHLLARGIEYGDPQIMSLVARAAALSGFPSWEPTATATAIQPQPEPTVAMGSTEIGRVDAEPETMEDCLLDD